jgi:hypothetical protein
MKTTKKFMLDYWQKELKTLNEKRMQCAWKIKKVKKQIENYL